MALVEHERPDAGGDAARDALARVGASRSSSSTLGCSPRADGALEPRDLGGDVPLKALPRRSR